MTTNHLSSEELSALLDGVLPARAAEEARRHLEGCAPCRDALAELSAQEERLRGSLSHDPGEAYFASFAERVGERIRAAERGAAVPAGTAPERRAPAWLGSPRKLTWVGAVAAVAVGVGIAFLASRETPVGPLRDRGAIERAERAAPPPREDFAAPPKATRPTPVPPPSQEMRAMNQPAPAAESAPAPVPSAGSTRATAPAPPAGSAQAPATPARLAPPLNDGPVAPDQRSRDEKLAAPPPAAGRAQEVRRTESGEEVPIPTVRAPLPQAAASPPAPVVPGKGVTVRKRAIATPMQSKEKPADEQSLAKPSQLDAAGSAQSDLEVTPATSQLCGEVRDPSGRPVAGASVVVVESQSTARTGRDGHFCVSAPAGERTLSVMAIGFQPARETVRAGAGAAPASITLQPISVLGGKAMSLGSLSRAPSGAFAALPDSVRAGVERAEALSSAAGRDRSASGWDRAAGAWAALAPALPVGAGQSAARFQLAAARYHAWELDPVAGRRATAAATLDAYLAAAPAGAERDQARGWRAQLGR